MKPRFELKDYVGKCVMHCDTEEKAKVFCNFLRYNNLTWCTGEDYAIDNCWSNYKEKTCYEFNFGKYGKIDFYRSERDYQILEFNDFDWSDNLKPKFKLEDYADYHVMHCDTQEKARIFLNRLHKIDESYQIDYLFYSWTVYREDTCYHFLGRTYGRKDSYKEKGYDVLEFDDFDWEEDDYEAPAPARESQLSKEQQLYELARKLYGDCQHITISIDEEDIEVSTHTSKKCE